MKKVTLLMIAALLVSFSVASAARWDWNKDLYNWGTETAYDLAVILDGKSPVDWHYDGYYAHHFGKFTSYPIAGYTCLHWTKPNNPVKVGEMAHVGAGGAGGNLKIIDMYWTDINGNRLPKSVVWNATSRVRYEGGEVVVCLVNLINVDAVPEGEQWANPREVHVADLRFVVRDEPVPLELLNNENEELNAEMMPLLPDAMIAPGEEMMIPLPADAAPVPGQFVIIRWDNLAEPIGGSDMTEARDWAQFEISDDGSTMGLEEQGSPEVAKLLNISSSPDYSDIRYQLPKAGNVSVSIYSISGERINNLVNEFSTAGEHTVRWNTESIPSGVYICRISAEGSAASSKIVHVK